MVLDKKVQGYVFKLFGISKMTFPACPATISFLKNSG